MVTFRSVSKKRVISLFVLFFVSLSSCFGDEGERRRNRLISRDYGYHLGGLVGSSKYDHKLKKLEYDDKLRDKLLRLNERYKELSLKTSRTDEEQYELDSVTSQRRFINAQLEGSLGDAVFRGIAGKKGYEMVEDITIGNDIFNGIYNGVMFRTSLSIGDALGKEIDGYVGLFFKVFLGQVEDIISSIYRFFFHNSCKPFEGAELKSWQDLVGKDFQQVELMIRNAEKHDSRGRAEILREYKVLEGDGDTGQIQDAALSANLWNDFVEDVANTCEDLAEEIDLRKGYYNDKENGFGVIQCADRLSNKLLKAKNCLLRVTSLKEFVNTPEVKSIIPSMKKSFGYYFDNLIAQVKLSSREKSQSKISSSYSSKDRWGSSYDDDEYPASYDR